MAIEIKTWDDDTLLVNDKEVRKDINGNWVAKEEMTPSETRAFRQHLKSMAKDGH